MKNMFNFLLDRDNYSSRVVGRYESSEGFVSTCAVSDGKYPYETALQHIEWEDKLIVVAGYDTKEEAKEGHLFWVTAFVDKTLPDELQEFRNSAIFDFADSIDVDFSPSVKRSKI